MLAIIPSAGKGTRLRPLTNIAPKPLLPVYNKAMIFYPLLSLQEAGIDNIVIVTDKENKNYFEDFFQDGKQFGLKISYRIQKEPKGIAHAVKQAKDLANGQEIAVMHGDNIFEGSLLTAVKNFKKQSFKQGNKKIKGAKIAIVRVDNPKRYGVVDIKGDCIIGIEEKPQRPKTNWICAGFYIFDKRVFDIIETLKPSKRGEYEISDLVDYYIQEGTATHEKLKGAWFDVGTIDSLHEASDYIAHNKKLREWQFDYK